MASRYYDQDYDRRTNREYYDDRGFLERAGDEVRSWFGDEEAERRRRIDNRLNEQRYRERDLLYSREGFDEIRAGDVMTRNVVTVYADESVTQAARLMAECDCGALPVIDSGRRFIGMITDRDIAIRIVGRGIDPRRARVDEAMTDETFACHVNDSLQGCMHQMARHQVRRIPVINDRDQLIGIISQADIARHAEAYQGRGTRREVADVLSAVSEPTRDAYR